MDLEGKRERNGRHVASVYFATRGMNLGPEDQFMLKILAAGRSLGVLHCPMPWMGWT
jgi:hypothetical protein